MTRKERAAMLKNLGIVLAGILLGILLGFRLGRLAVPTMTYGQVVMLANEREQIGYRNGFKACQEQF